MPIGLQHFTDRVGEGTGHPRLDSAGGEELMHVQPGVAIVLSRRSPESPGTLYISTRRVMWLSDTERDKGYAVDFLFISLHAVSRDPEAYPSPCIYTQIDTEVAEDDESEGSDAECPDNTDISKITEIRLVPFDPNQLDTLFDIFSICIDLNPEPLEGEDEENSWVFGDEGFTDDGDQHDWKLSEDLANPIGYANGNHGLTHFMLNGIISEEVPTFAKAPHGFLLRWKNQPPSDDTWMEKCDLEKLAPDLVADYINFNLAEQSSLRSGGVDAKQKHCPITRSISP